jgi:hypothetical protein
MTVKGDDSQPAPLGDQSGPARGRPGPGWRSRLSWRIPRQRNGDEPAWWFKDVVLVGVLSLLFFGVQWVADEGRQHGVDRLEDSRQASIDRSDDRRQSEDNRRENLRFVRERVSTDPNENRPFANLDLEELTLKGLEI